MLVETLKLYLEFPKALIEKLWPNKEKAAQEIKKAAVLDLVRRQEITSSYGAELLEMNYHDFLDLLAQAELPVVNYPPGDLKEEMARLEGVLLKESKEKNR